MEGLPPGPQVQNSLVRGEGTRSVESLFWNRTTWEMGESFFPGRGSHGWGAQGHWVGAGDDDMTCEQDEVWNPGIWPLAVGTGTRELKGR